MTEPASPAVSALPNILTGARLALAPVIAGLLFWAGENLFSAGRDAPLLLYGAALALFLLAALTDLFDGRIARARGAVTALGAALDHAADKALVTACLIALAVTALPFDLVIAAALIVTRDVAVAGLREGLALSGRALPVNSLGKAKTVAEMTGVATAIALQCAALGLPEGVEGGASLITGLIVLARAALWTAAALALVSGAVYLRAALARHEAPTG